ncbi:MAG: SCP2 sterol-binding domain-containing protein [Anaerolineae bacterium]|nr:SCP2 sterol-binding domain-containing protein [Anaerolineae bacterium]
MATQQEVAQLFTSMAENFDPARAEGVNATIQFDLSGDNGGLYWVKMFDGQAESGSGQAASPNMTLRASADDWAAVATGEMNPMQAFMSGKLKIQGDMGLAMKLQSLIG